MNISFTELTGSSVKLVPLRPEHAEGLYEASKHPEIWTYLPQKITSLISAERWIIDALQQQETGKELPLVVVDQTTGRIVGSTRLLNISIPNRQLEIGWTWYNPSVWRTKVNTECKYLLLQYCFENLHTVRVQFTADARNDRSNKAIKRIGAIQEGVLRKNRILEDGYIRDACVYSIIEDEWSSVKSKLQQFLLKDYADFNDAPHPIVYNIT
ncbi:GNAT family N-acetyltransferase [Cohnella silvisoli]|uniref:GNAT family N-acetyltransferase n=1 Tax=Cohnella silvisoli TaxID=2873699 RepID=A0ABV1L1W1_9BACL|nr:GNAT family N-acetyltransferase [Cohnella silvisoli]MCD9026448.1 GNAT family N-acetyltransferase [Cohnella silvisoli]